MSAVNFDNKTLIVITGATASGKSALAINVALDLGCEIISADSRQIYRDMPIGTAAPTSADLARVPHHMVGILPVTASYSAASFESDVLALLPRLWEKSDYAVLCGGSMMYIDAVTDGIDLLPDISPGVREHVRDLIEGQGLEAALALLEIVDPVYAAEVDRANPRRVAHALEISLQAGEPYSSMRCGKKASRPFRIIKTAIDMPRPELFERIDSRVTAMVDAGWIEEARRLYPMRGLNALNTVGYKELFDYFDGKNDLPATLARIARNTRVYAKKQLTWLARPGVMSSIKLPAHPTASYVTALR